MSVSNKEEEMVEPYFVDNFIVILPNDKGTFHKKNEKCKTIWVKLYRDAKKRAKFEVEY